MADTRAEMMDRKTADMKAERMVGLKAVLMDRTTVGMTAVR